MSTSKNRFTSYGPNMTMDRAATEATPVASYPPGHFARTLSDGTVQVYQGDPTPGGITDRRPSKLRAAMARITPKSGDNQQLNVLERAASSQRLADINHRNRNRYDQENPWGRR
jgi:hypothetical protein